MSVKGTAASKAVCRVLSRMLHEKMFDHWSRRIRDANPAELRQIMCDLRPLVGFNIEGLVQKDPAIERGHGQAKIFLEIASKRLFEEDFKAPFKEFQFPFSNDQRAAQRVLGNAWMGIEQLVNESPYIMLNDRIAVLNMSLRRCLNSEIERVLKYTGRSAILAETVDRTLESLSINIQNLFLLKLLEAIEIIEGPEDELAWLSLGRSMLTNPKWQRLVSDVEKVIAASLNKLPIDEFNKFSQEQSSFAAIAMFFVFRNGRSELDASKFHYVFHLVKAHPRPADLITEYSGLREEERHRLTLHEDAAMIAAIGSGRVRCFKDILGLKLNP